MSNTSYHIRGSYLATATALLLNLPPVGDLPPAGLTPVSIAEYEPFADASKAISEAFDSRTYSRATPEAVFLLLTEVATRLIQESKPLDRDFARVVDREFWNLLR